MCVRRYIGTAYRATNVINCYQVLYIFFGIFHQEPEDIKHVPVGDNGKDLEEQVLIHDEGTGSSSRDSMAADIRKLVSLQEMGIRSNRRTLTRIFDPYLKQTENRLTHVEAGLNELQGHMGQMKEGFGKLEERMAGLEGSFQLKFENLKTFISGSNKDQQG